MTVWIHHSSSRFVVLLMPSEAWFLPPQEGSLKQLLLTAVETMAKLSPMLPNWKVPNFSDHCIGSSERKSIFNFSESGDGHGKLISKGVSTINSTDLHCFPHPGIPAYIVVPRTAPNCKKLAIQAYGASIVYSEPSDEVRKQSHLNDCFSCLTGCCFPVSFIDSSSKLFVPVLTQTLLVS